MAAVAVLNPRDAFSPLPKLDLGQANPTRARHGRRRRSPTKSPNTSPPPRPAKTLVMGEVKLLRRGADELPGTVLMSPPANRPAELRRVADSARISGSVVGPAPEPVARPSRAHAELPKAESSAPKAMPEPTTGSVLELGSFYAGAHFVTSPPPSSLPVPAFCAKKNGPPGFGNPTSDLRKLLRLE